MGWVACFFNKKNKIFKLATSIGFIDLMSEFYIWIIITVLYYIHSDLVGGRLHRFTRACITDSLALHRAS